MVLVVGLAFSDDQLKSLTWPQITLLAALLLLADSTGSLISKTILCRHVEHTRQGFDETVSLIL